ncbi:hypothetical protein SAMN04489740_2014 [Arthrobacter alpinus]|uniref:Uncharacterized protein n=1 Tax=Arthrobacter alpinus TaxID=656366 RepID=A0A1H5KH45_9MICC|nr:hypothetical protein [Arthrobacter alpinus]SEE64152.1 hypothetical protein SAMN04489740_2014 [Arthrobacter alpinus]
MGTPNAATADQRRILRSSTGEARNRLPTDDLIGKLNAAWNVQEQVRTLLRGGSLEDAEIAKEHLEYLFKGSNQLETTGL